MSNVKCTGPLEMILYTPLIKKIIKHKLFSKISPNFITGLNMLLIAIVTILILQQKILLGFIIYATYPFFDLLDGALAREYNKSTYFGRFLDSFSDIVGEIVVLISLMIALNEPIIANIIMISIIIISKLTSALAGINKLLARLEHKKIRNKKASTEKYYDLINYKFLFKKNSIKKKLLKTMYNTGMLLTRNDTRKIIAIILIILNLKIAIIPYYLIIFIGVFFEGIFSLIKLDQNVRN